MTKTEYLAQNISLISGSGLLDCRHAVEVGDSKTKDGYQLYLIYNRHWQKISPKAIFARSELEAIIRFRGILEAKLAGLVRPA